MKNYISAIIGFVVGGAVGAVGMYFFNKKRMEAQIEEEVEAVKEYYKNKAENTETEDAAPEPEKKSSEEVITKKEQRSVKVDANVEPDYEQIIEKLNYNKYSTAEGSSLNPEPYIISANEYNNEGFEYEKVRVSWFLDDEVLMDDDTDKVVDDVEQSVGFGNLELFGKSDGGDDDELFIRNEKLGIDYHVIMEEGSYANYIASMGD